MNTEQSPCGVLLLDKPAGVTSHDMVGLVRRLYGTRRVGHTGTLDPMATGLLVVLVGRAAKAAEFLSVHEKRYAARLRLGLTTDTEDVTGRLLSTTDDLPDAEAVAAILPDFTGEILQCPPMYSALKVNGQKLVDLARRGVSVERTARPVTIRALTAAPTDDPAEYALDVTCSAGTYIRTLCADMGAKLGCGGVMAALRRHTVGDFSVADARTPAELEALSPAERLACLRPIESLFAGWPALDLPPFFARLAHSGCEIYERKTGISYPPATRLRLLDGGRFFAIGEVRAFPDGLAVKPIKQFDVE